MVGLPPHAMPTRLCFLAASTTSFRRPSCIVLAMMIEVVWLKAPPLTMYPLKQGRLHEQYVWEGEGRGGEEKKWNTVDVQGL